MTDLHQVFLVLDLHHRVLHWDSLNRVEFDFFQDMLEEHGLLAILRNERMCAVEASIYDASGDIERIDFWLKIRGQWMFLSLEVRSPNVFVLGDTKRRSGP